MADSIFQKQMLLGGLSSKVRYNREYLLNNHVAEDLNTYLSFSPFKTFNDLYDPHYKPSTGTTVVDKEYKQGPGTPGVRSIFNRYGAVALGSATGDLDVDVRKEVSEWRIANNVPLMDSRTTRQAIRAHSGCTVRELVEASRAGVLGRNTYAYSDFMYCKHLGKIPNNYLVTLRRFPVPVDDYISAMGTTFRKNPGLSSQNCESIGCMVTWMGAPGNEINNILKYTVQLPFKEEQAQWEDANVDADAGKGVLNQLVANLKNLCLMINSR